MRPIITCLIFWIACASSDFLCGCRSNWVAVGAVATASTVPAFASSAQADTPNDNRVNKITNDELLLMLSARANNIPLSQEASSATLVTVTALHALNKAQAQNLDLHIGRLDMQTDQFNVKLRELQDRMPLPPPPEDQNNTEGTGPD